MNKNCFKVLLFMSSIILLILLWIFFKNFNNYIKIIYNFGMRQAEKHGNYIEAEKFYKKKIYYSNNDIIKDNEINALIEFYIKQRQYDNALNLYLEKLNNATYFNSVYHYSLFEEKKLKLAYTYNEIAFLYIKTGNLKKAKEYVEKAFDSLGEAKNKKTTKKVLCLSYRQLANIEIIKGNYSKAKEYIETIRHIINSSEYIKNTGESALAEYYDIMFNYYFAKEDYNNAQIYAKKLFFTVPATILPVELASELFNQGEYLADFNERLGKTYFRQKKLLMQKDIF